MIDFPFCIMWANENWTRRWDGRSDDVLIGQNYEEVPAEAFIDDILPFLLDDRYLKVDGKPLLSVYRPGQMVTSRRSSKLGGNERLSTISSCIWSAWTSPRSLMRSKGQWTRLGSTA